MTHLLKHTVYGITILPTAFIEEEALLRIKPWSFGLWTRGFPLFPFLLCHLVADHKVFYLKGCYKVDCIVKLAIL